MPGPAGRFQMLGLGREIRRYLAQSSAPPVAPRLPRPLASLRPAPASRRRRSWPQVRQASPPVLKGRPATLTGPACRDCGRGGGGLLLRLRRRRRPADRRVAFTLASPSPRGAGPTVAAPQRSHGCQWAPSHVIVNVTGRPLASLRT